ncbi:hypothetical protein [Pontibacter sp. G13]|uniref:MORN repeat-containing protein n=1 Tax=Pontibacter sp. G13 TaxID=3074898 RepID=UPI002889AEED|nr:hypothetical protein [Pontibacter sp. G13]WNJ16506.1 hypothetical protein RJD25_16695 [Pontibacter sp. G13]
MELEPLPARDRVLRQRIEEKAEEIRKIRSQHQFMAYADHGHLFEELEALYAENRLQYERCYLQNRDRLNQFQHQLQDANHAIHALSRDQLLKLLRDAEALLEMEDYTENAKSAQLLLDFEAAFKKAQSTFLGWMDALDVWEQQLEQLKMQVWSEDFQQFEQAWKEARKLVKGNSQFPVSLGINPSKRAEAIEKRNSEFEPFLERMRKYPSFLSQAQELAGSPCSRAEFLALKNEANRFLFLKKRKRIVGIGIAATVVMAALVLGPMVQKRMQEDDIWELAQEEGTIEALREYQQLYPNGKYFQEAKVALFEITEGKLAGLVDIDSARYDYEGDLMNLLPNGYGVATYDNGATYEGYWTMGKRDSIGKITHANGGSYDGHWNMGVREGQGIAINPDKSKYEGQWRDNLYHGSGRLALRNRAFQQGIWENGHLNGQGKARDAFGNEYAGEFLKGQYHGSGNLRHPDGTLVAGKWEYGVQIGEGIIEFPDGRTFRGKWTGGLREGDGRIDWPNGSYFMGRWVADTIQGKGSFVSRFRDEYSGQWAGRPEKIILYDGSGNVFKVGKWQDGLFLDLDAG